MRYCEECTPSTPVTLRWTSVGTDSCSGVGFSTGGRRNGPLDMTAAAVAEDVDTYTLICEKNGTLLPPERVTLTTFANPPELKVDKTLVRIGDPPVMLEWDTNNGNELFCTLTGGGLVSEQTLGNGTGDGETGRASVPISGRTTFTLTCGLASDSITVEIVPSGWET